MIIKELPDDATEHKIGDASAVTIPADGFDKLIVFDGPKGLWVHKNFQIIPEKTKKKSKKRG